MALWGHLNEACCPSHGSTYMVMIHSIVLNPGLHSHPSLFLWLLLPVIMEDFTESLELH